MAINLTIDKAKEVINLEIVEGVSLPYTPANDSEVVKDVKDADGKSLKSGNTVNLPELGSDFDDYPTKNEVGITTIKEDTNILQEATNSSLEDTDIWGDGYLLQDGSVFNYEGYKFTKKFYRIEPGNYRFRWRLHGDSKAIFYDINYNVIGCFSGQWSGFSTYDLMAPEGTRFFRTSLAIGDPSILPNTYLHNNEQFSTFAIPTTEEVKKINNTVPVSGKGVSDFTIETWRKGVRFKPSFPVISFISDDGQIENDKWFIPLLESKEIKGTFAIVSNWMDGADKLSSQRVKELYNSGHDIASHSFSHPRLATDITLQQAEEEIMQSKMGFLKLGIDTDIFVAPFSDRNVEVDRLIRKFYSWDFAAVPDATSENCTNKPPIDSYLLKRVSLDAEENGVSTLQSSKGAVDTAIANGGWLTFVIHPHYPEYSETENPSGYVTKRQEVSDLIDYIQSFNVPILTAKQALKLYENPVQIGNVRLDDKYYALGMDGTEDDKYFI